MIEKTKLIGIIFFLFVMAGDMKFSFAQGATSASQIQRSQEILDNEEALIKRLEEEEQFFIKKIVVKGALSLKKDKIKEIILPFQKKWLDKTGVMQIIELLDQAYIQIDKGAPQTSYQIKKHTLEFKITEEKQ